VLLLFVGLFDGTIFRWVWWIVRIRRLLCGLGVEVVSIVGLMVVAGGLLCCGRGGWKAWCCNGGFGGLMVGSAFPFPPSWFYVVVFWDRTLFIFWIGASSSWCDGYDGFELGWWWLRWIEMEVMRMSGGEVLTWRC
jgi:hypothetical protein